MQIVAGQQEHEIATRRFTLVVPAANMHHRIRYPGHVTLDLEACEYHIRLVQKLHLEFQKFFSIVFPDVEISPENIRQQSTGVLHVAGRVDMTLKLQDLDAPIVWQYPEAGLHPATQLQLADLMIALRLRSRTPTETVEEALADLDHRLNPRESTGKSYN